jgi:hypothetical protein
MERGDAGEVRVPTYAQDRILYGLSDPEQEQANFEQLLRHAALARG